MTTTSETLLASSRRRDAGRRWQRVHQAIVDMGTDGSEVTVSSVAARARVHRSFIHRHAAVLKAAADAIAGPSPAATAISHKSALAENANGTAAIQAELEAERQAVLDLRRALEERDDELAAARETNRRPMNQVNRPGARENGR